MNKKENWLRLIKNDDPGWIGPPWEAFKGNFFGDIFVADPISLTAGGKRVVGTPYQDGWGVTWLFKEGHPGANPHITAENKVLKDISVWKETVHFPPLDGHDWTDAKNFMESVDRSEYLTISFLPGGLFERSHYLMGFEDALCNYMMAQETIFELVGAIADWKIGQIERIYENLHPDAIHFHDDWGHKSNLFLPPEIWREIIKPHHTRIVDAVKSRGMIFMHHSDSFCEPIVEDMVEMGIDIWQGVIPQNDIPSIQKKLSGRMALMGGIDAQIIDKQGQDEAVVREEVRRCIDTYCPAGWFIPCIPNIIPIYPEVAAVYNDELISYGKDFFTR